VQFYTKIAVLNGFMQLCMASGINIYSFFSDNRNSYSRYLKKTILDIPNQVRILDIKKVILDIKNNFGYPKINIYFRYQK